MTLHVREVVLESIKERGEDFVLGLLTTLNIGMLLGVVGLADIVDVNLAGLVGIEDVESLLCGGDTSGIHLTNDSSKELVVGELTGAITIEDGPGGLNLLLVETHAEVVHGLIELSGVKSLGAVVVSDLELSAEGRDTTGASSLDLVLDMLKDGGLAGVLGNTVGSLLGGTSPRAGLLGSTGLRSVEDVVVLFGSRLLGRIGTPALLAHTNARLLSELPSVLHHELEVHIVIDTNGDVVVVLFELLLGDDVVRGLVFTHGVSSLEGLKELLEDLLLSLLA